MTNDHEQMPEDMPENNAENASPEFAAGNAAEGTAEPVADTPESVIAALQAEVADAKDKMMRALADAENTRRRAMKDREDASKYAVSSFARDLLDFADNFGRAIAAIPEELRADERIASIVQGIQAMDTQFANTMERHGIKKIEPLDEPFNPNFHEVMFEAPVPGKPAGIVIQVVEGGYVLNDRLLRAAKVGVSKGDGETAHQVDQKA